MSKMNMESIWNVRKHALAVPLLHHRAVPLLACAPSPAANPSASGSTPSLI